jgi:hypothetical protein
MTDMLYVCFFFLAGVFFFFNFGGSSADTYCYLGAEGGLRKEDMKVLAMDNYSLYIESKD